MPTTSHFETCIDFELAIGESPVWDEEKGLLWFIDVLRPAAFTLEPASGTVVEYPMPDEIGSLGLVAGGKLIVALRSGVHIFDPATRSLQFLVHPEPGRPTNRLNDGKVGPDGSFWVGSMHDALPRQPTASLYRVTPSGEVTTIIDGLRVSNGLAWNPDGTTMYHADSRGPVVRAFDFDPGSGQVSNQRTIIVLDEKGGLPDGAAVDVEGCYWSAGISAGVLNRFTAHGSLLETLVLPVAAPTMPCFGGPDFKTMFVTSLTTDRDGKHSTGTLIAFDVAVPGLPTYRFPEQAPHALHPA